MKAYDPSKEHIATLENNETRVHYCLEYGVNPAMIQVMQMLQVTLKDIKFQLFLSLKLCTSLSRKSFGHSTSTPPTQSHRTTQLQNEETNP